MLEWSVPTPDSQSHRTLVSPRVMSAAAIACITTGTLISAFETPSTVGRCLTAGSTHAFGSA